MVDFTGVWNLAPTHLGQFGWTFDGLIGFTGLMYMFPITWAGAWFGRSNQHPGHDRVVFNENGIYLGVITRRWDVGLSGPRLRTTYRYVLICSPFLFHNPLLRILLYVSLFFFSFPSLLLLNYPSDLILYHRIPFRWCPAVDINGNPVARLEPEPLGWSYTGQPPPPAWLCRPAWLYQSRPVAHSQPNAHAMGTQQPGNPTWYWRWLGFARRQQQQQQQLQHNLIGR